MAEERRRVVTLSKAQAETAAGRELVDLLTELSADGNVTREEMDRLRAWLEVDRSVDFPAMSFLYETIDQISADGEITEDELDLLALAIERVLPKGVRKDGEMSEWLKEHAWKANLERITKQRRNTRCAIGSTTYASTMHLNVKP